jgi:indolepyruvate ferredoxin oxidoreductase alpha subunit
MKAVLTGNEAIARGAYEAGVKFAAAYPGTPSSEILDTIAKEYEEIYAEWSPNEKVALEAAMGACFVGARALVCMKHVGVNVAADPLLTLAYTGVKGGLVLLTADDPELYSSQNEQDNRHYARFAKIPMLEPSDSQEAKEFVKLGFAISEQFDTPVMVRSVTRISHSKTIVELEERREGPIPIEIKKDPSKYVMLPVHGRKRHEAVEERYLKLKDFVEAFPENRVETNDRRVGIVTSGISYQYAKEVFPDYSYLKLGICWPLPEKLITRFFQQVEEVYVIEELDPFLEESIRAMGFTVSKGKDCFPIRGELTPLLIEKGVLGDRFQPPKPVFTEELPPRPPNLCPGCPHRGLFYVLKKGKFFVTGDIGCYTLAALPPLNSLDTCVCMGASIGHAHGISKVVSAGDRKRVVGVIGDSTFLHGGVTPLMDIGYNKGTATIIILDNHATAMTGFQEHPSTGFTIRGEPTHKVDFLELGKVLGIKNRRKVNPWNLEEMEKVIAEEVEKDEPSLIVSEGPCVMLRQAIKEYHKPYAVDADVCTGCRVCLSLGCPAISWQVVTGDKALTATGKKRKGIAAIEETLCPGCGLCYQVCTSGAIIPPEGEVKHGFELV